MCRFPDADGSASSHKYHTQGRQKGENRDKPLQTKSRKFRCNTNEVGAITTNPDTALGGGFELALTCDLIVASETAKFGLVETSLGLLPLLGGVQRVTQRAGAARGKEIAMFGRRHDPHTLERWNILNLVVPDTELPDAARSWAQQLGNGPTVAYQGVKELANLTARTGLESADGHQETANAAMWSTDDMRAGLDAFAATGPGTATFEGR